MHKTIIITTILFAQACNPVFASLRYAMNIPKDVKEQMQADFVFLQALKGSGSSPLFKKIFGGNLNGQTLTKFFDVRITEVGWDRCGEAVACVLPGIDPHTMYVTQFYAQSSVSQILRLSIVFHESRHSEMENNYWSHANCPEVGVNGQPIISSITGKNLFELPGCDDVAEGAYGMEFVLLKNIEKFCSTCNEKVLMDAQIAGDDLLNRISQPKPYKLLQIDCQ